MTDGTRKATTQRLVFAFSLFTVAMTAWLPAVRLARRRYWLPLSVPTGDALAAHLLGRAAGSDHSASLTDCLTRDPAFFYLALYHWQRVFANTPIEPLAIRLSQLAAFTATHWPHWFRSGDASLGAPRDHRFDLRRLAIAVSRNDRRTAGALAATVHSLVRTSGTRCLDTTT